MSDQIASIAIKIDVSDALKGLKALRTELQKVIHTVKELENVVIDKEAIDYYPHPAQEKVHQSKARFKFIITGARWGKDMCSLSEGIYRFAEILGRKTPPPKMMIIGPTYPHTRMLWYELLKLFPHRWCANINATEKTIKTIAGGEIAVVCEKDIDCLPPLDICIISEAALIPDFCSLWSNVLSSLIIKDRGYNGKGGCAIVNSTPRKGSDFNHYVKHFLYALSSSERYEVFNYPTSSNPMIMKDLIEEAKRTMSDEEFREQYLGEVL